MEQNEDNIGTTISEALRRREFITIRRILRKIGPADISEVLENFEMSQFMVVFRLIPKSIRSEVFAFLSFERQIAMLDLLPDLVTVRLLNDLEPVDRTKLLEELPEEVSQRFISFLTPKEKEITERILSFPEGSVGRIMSPEFLSLHQDVTASEGIEQIRWKGSQFSENLISIIFVVDDDFRYIGQVTIAGLIAADPPRRPVSEIAQTTQPGLSVFASEVDAVDFFRKYDEPLIPVVDEHNILIGVVESDDVFDIAEEEATEDIQLFGGQGSLEDSYFQTPVTTLIRKRAGWLALLFFGMMFTTNALQSFQVQIQKWSFLVVFLPLIISSGGNSGSQAASLMIRGLAVKEVDLADWLRVLKREVIIGLCLGLILGILGFSRVMAFGGIHEVGIIVASALIGVVTFGALAGAMLPFLLKVLKLDPAVSSSPVIASIVDIVGIVIFFKVAIFMMS